MLVILGGVALLHILVLGGLAVTGGCASDNDALEGKAYIPSPDPEPVAPVQTTQQPVYDTPTQQPVAPQPVAPVKSEYPSFESFQSSNPAPATPSKSEFLKHTVAKGESLWKISRMYGVSTEELAAFNNLSANKTIKVGQVINIPPGGHAVTKTAAAKTEKKSIAPAAAAVPAKKDSKKDVKKDAKKEEPKKDSKKEAAAPAGTEEYTIKAGDSLAKIASKYHVKASAIAEANKITDDRKLRIGQKLVIPKASAKVATAAAKTEEKKAAAPEHTDKPAATEHKDELLDDIPAPGAAAKPAAEAAPVAAPVVAPATEAAPAAEAGLTHEIEEDTTVENIAAQFGVSADAVRKLNPNLPADGKLKAGIAIKLP